MSEENGHDWSAPTPNPRDPRSKKGWPLGVVPDRREPVGYTSPLFPQEREKGKEERGPKGGGSHPDVATVRSGGLGCFRRDGKVETFESESINKARLGQFSPSRVKEGIGSQPPLFTRDTPVRTHPSPNVYKNLCTLNPSVPGRPRPLLRSGLRFSGLPTTSHSPEPPPHPSASKTPFSNSDSRLEGPRRNGKKDDGRQRSE